MRRWKYAPWFILFPRIFAGVEIINGPPFAVGTVHAAAEYVFYGPRSPFIYAGPATFLSGNEVCSPSRTLQGLIVISPLRDLDCDLGDAYDSLNAAQAKAFITLEPWNPPGWSTFHRPLTEKRECTMAMVSITEWPSDSVTWTDKNLAVLISPPFDTTVANEYALPWTITIKGFAAAWSFLVSAESAVEMTQLYLSGRLDKSWIAFFIFAIEAPTMFIIGVALALGHGGPYVLPYVFYTPFIDLLSGWSVASTMLLALFLSQQSSHFRSGLPQQGLWSKHWRLLTLGGAMLVLASVAFPMVAVIGVSPLFAAVVPRALRESICVIFYVAVLVPSQLVVSIIFLVHAWDHRSRISQYLMAAWMPTPHVELSHIRIGRLSFWISMSAICMVSSCVLFVYILAVAVISTSKKGLDYKGPEDYHAVFNCFKCFIFARIGVSYSQIAAIRKGRYSITELLVVPVGLRGTATALCPGDCNRLLTGSYRAPSVHPDENQPHTSEESSPNDHGAEVSFDLLRPSVLSTIIEQSEGACSSHYNGNEATDKGQRHSGHMPTLSDPDPDQDRY